MLLMDIRDAKTVKRTDIKQQAQRSAGLVGCYFSS